MKVADYAATGPKASTTLPGFLPALSGNASEFLNGLGQWGDPAAATGVTKLVAGTNVTLNPTSGVGTVTVNAQGGSGGAGVTSVATGTGLTGGPITATGTIKDADQPVTPGTYGDGTHVSQITVNQQGRITSAVDVPISSGAGGTVTQVNTGTGLTGGPITGTGTVAMSATGVSASTYGSATQVPQIAVNAEGQITSASNVAITGTLPSGGSAYQQLYKTSSTAYALGYFSPSIIDAAAYLANGATIQQAFTEACNANGTLLLPPGSTALPNGGLVLPAGFTGGVGILGCGKNVSILTQANATPGISLVPNVGTPANTWFDLRGFTLQTSNSGAGYGLAVDFGTGSIVYPNQTAGGNCTFDDINGNTTGSGTWSSLFYFRSVWYSNAKGLSGLGISNTAGNAITIDSCINFQFSEINICGYLEGFYVPAGSAGVGNSQGINLSNFRAVQVKFAIDSVSPLWVTNFMVDDGNGAISGAVPVRLQCGVTSLGSPGCFSCGQILNDGAAYAMELNGCNRITVQNVDFYYKAGSPTADIWLTNGTELCSVQGCTFGSGTSILADSGTSGSKAFNNINGTFTDNGSNSLVS